MDELIIEDKKYVSSKRAAKLTGYAKDYVGQLCREGRVPARLVGRSWYVLEAAIQDHRFGSESTDEPKKSPAKTQSAEATHGYATWESPRYEPSSPEPLPSINRLKSDFRAPAVEPLPVPPVKPVNEVEHLQNAWSSWFTSISQPAEPENHFPENEAATTEAPALQPEQAIRLEESDVTIPIHSVYELPPEDLMPKNPITQSAVATSFPQSEYAASSRQLSKQNGSIIRPLSFLIVLIGSAAALAAVALAALNSGYFDQKQISHTRLNSLSGISVYSKVSK